MNQESGAEVFQSTRSVGRIEAELLRGRARLDGVASAWASVLTDTPGGSPFAHPDWTRTWLDSFAPAAAPLLVKASVGAEPVGFAPLLEQSTKLVGLPFRVWRTPANEHSQRTDWAIADGDGTGRCASPGRAGAEDVVRAIWRTLQRSPEWEVLQLPNLVEGGLVDRVLGEAAGADGCLVYRQPSLQSPWLPVPTPSGLQTALDAKFRANLRRRRRKLAAHGELRLVRAEGGPLALEVLREGLQLEASGWKGRQGTAIASSADTMQFYSSLARALEAQGWLSLYLLRVGDRPVAFHYALTHRGRYHVLKPAYDETLSACSPGQLLVEEVLRDLHARGVQVFDFLGPSMVWKLDWTNRICAHCCTWVIRPSVKGRLLAGHFRLDRRARGLARAVRARLTKEARR